MTNDKAPWTRILQDVATDYRDGKFKVYRTRTTIEIEAFNKLLVRASKRLSNTKETGIFTGIVMSVGHQRNKHNAAWITKQQLEWLERLAKS